MKRQCDVLGSMYIKSGGGNVKVKERIIARDFWTPMPSWMSIHSSTRLTVWKLNLSLSNRFAPPLVLCYSYES